jgi:hypothetical protein
VASRPPSEYRPDLRPLIILVGALVAVVVGWVLLSSVILPPPPPQSVTPGARASSSAGSEEADAEGAQAWREARVEQPAPVTNEPSNEPGTACSPCHPSVITRMRDVAKLDDGGLVAVGTAAPGRSLVWLSADGLEWSMTPNVPDREGTGLAAVAATSEAVVAVGVREGRPVAWYSPDGRTWQPARGQDSSGHGEMNSVVAFRGGFVAAGGAGPAFGEGRSAAFWTSADGRQWQRVPDAPGLHAGHVWGVAVSRGKLVAVGTSGDPQNGPAVSWTSRDGRDWTRSEAGPEMEGVMLSITGARSGFVAVGRSSDGSMAAAWQSRDGVRWQAAPPAPSLESDTAYGAHAEMSDVMRLGGRLVAVGWVSSSANGTGVAWTSRGGLTWERLPSAASLPGGGMAAVIAHDGQVVAVGSTGWPDTHAADVWVASSGAER